MRYLTVRVEPSGGGAFHPLGERLTDEPSIERRAIHHVDLLADDTVLLFAEASGSRERYRQIMDGSPHVHEYLVAGDDHWVAVSQLEPTEGARRALELQQESRLVIDTPIRFTASGALKMTCIGTDETFGELSETIDETAPVTFEVLEMGDYDPDESSFGRMVTSRQEEVLEAAVDLGYYNEPRRATLEDVAEVVGIAPTTVGEHLRKVEERVFGDIVR